MMTKNGIKKMYMSRIKKWLHNVLEPVAKQLHYFGDNTTLHGVRYVISKKYLPLYTRIFWLLVLIASATGAWMILQKILSLYATGAVSYLVETDYLDFDTPFPAVTICEQSNSDGVKSYIHHHNVPASYSLFLKEVSFWSNNCKICPTCQNHTCFNNFGQAVSEIRAKCSEMLTDCWWDNKPFVCCERFLPIETEYGVCYVFNSRLTGNETSYVVNRRVGLPHLVFLATEEVGIRVHSPDDMVSVVMDNVLGKPTVIPMITDFEVILKAEQTISDNSVSTMTPVFRACLYTDEKPAFAPNWPFKRYSPSNCFLYCRVLIQLSKCNCTHHLMPKIDGVSFCDIEGLICLSKNKGSLGNVDCECPMSCEETSYKLVHMFMYRYTGKPSPELAARGSRGLVKLAQLPASRVRRDAIRHTLGLVVDIGGVGGVFFGASLLNALEIIYLLCIRRND